MKRASIFGILCFLCWIYTWSQSTSHRPANISQDEFEWCLVTEDRVPIYVFEAGHGPRLVALHGGFGMEHSYMRTFLKDFEQDYHIVYYDQRGSMRSPVPGNDFKKYISMEHMVNDLELLRKETGGQKLNLVAHSMGAVLAYEYMSRYPDQVENLVIISGFAPKFPDSPAAFYDMFQSQKEREAFKNRPEVQQEIAHLKESMDTTSRSYLYHAWRITSASCQIYRMDRWTELDGGPSFFNGEMNKIIGPESHLPLSYSLKFMRYQRMFNQGKIDTTRNAPEFISPVDYLPVIKNHPHKISYLLGQYEVGDFNLRIYKRYLGQLEGVDLHIFDKACHNIWIDQPEAFAKVLAACLAQKPANEIK